MINRRVKFILLLFFPLVLAASSCVGQADDSAPNNNYTVDFSTVKKAALKYFDIQKNMIKDWKDCAISLENPNRCVNLRERLPVIFLISRWVIPKRDGWPSAP